MKIEINGQQIIGLDRYIIKAIVGSICEYCLHKTITHTELGCTAFECKCEKGFTSYLLINDEDFTQVVISEGLFS